MQWHRGRLPQYRPTRGALVVATLLDSWDPDDGTQNIFVVNPNNG